ncbi:MAG: NAD(P)-binding domain-containing protein [Actinomycetota bacterium]|jgi:8-hydroxy-5-deazaflavin:NADPH oxidoreductase
MRIGLLGTGVVGQTLGHRLVRLDHEVMMGSREAGNDKAVAWCEAAGVGASQGSFADAAAFGELVVNATAGTVSLEALVAAGSASLAGKVLVDVANPLDFSAGMPPTLSVCNTDSLGERIQREFPRARVVKTLNTVNADVMVTPSLAGPSHTVFVCGNDDEAKVVVRELLESFGWPPSDIMDLGDIAGARATEMLMPLWLRLWTATGTGHLNIRVVTGP